MKKNVTIIAYPIGLTLNLNLVEIIVKQLIIQLKALNFSL